MAKENSQIKNTSEELLDYLGGKENISFYTHCLTRLRFNLKDRSRLSEEEIHELPLVVGTKWVGNQFQVIISDQLLPLFEAVDNQLKETKKTAVADVPWIQRLLDAFTGCFTPLLPLMIASGLLKSAVIIAVQLNLMAAGSGTIMFLERISDAGFYFLPIFVGATAARRFETNQGMGMVIGAMLVYPDLFADLGTGLPRFFEAIQQNSYAYSVFPTILSVYVMSRVEKYIGRIVPALLQSVLTPFLTLVIMIPVSFLVVAPFGGLLGSGITQGIVWLYGIAGFVGVSVFSGVWPFLVMTGMHSAIVPYQTESFATLGYEPIALTAILIANFNQGAAALAVAWQTKKPQVRSSGLTCGLTAFVAGVTEPAMFAINLRYVYPMVAAVIGSLIGGGFAGAGGVRAYAYVGSAGLFGLPVFMERNTFNLIWMIISCLIGVSITFCLTIVFGKIKKVKNEY